MTRSEAVEKICVALDVPNAEAAFGLATQLKDHVGFFKVGMELYNAEGPSVVRGLRALGAKIFLDLKFHDIPNTVAGASRIVAPLGVSMFNLHASGGIEMMRASLLSASESATKTGVACPRIIAVTVLTSLDDQTFKEITQSDVNVARHTEHLAVMAKQAGLDGVVASPQEIQLIRAVCGQDFLIVTPGVRPSGGDVGDQKRVATPAGAIQAGADILVIGRPITAARDPVASIESILGEIQGTSG
jgi:orotidine-5'-phosphate decarboxylase